MQGKRIIYIDIINKCQSSLKNLKKRNTEVYNQMQMLPTFVTRTENQQIHFRKARDDGVI